MYVAQRRLRSHCSSKLCIAAAKSKFCLDTVLRDILINISRTILPKFPLRAVLTWIIVLKTLSAPAFPTMMQMHALKNAWFLKSYLLYDQFNISFKNKRLTLQVEYAITTIYNSSMVRKSYNHTLVVL